MIASTVMCSDNGLKGQIRAKIKVTSGKRCGEEGVPIRRLLN